MNMVFDDYQVFIDNSVTAKGGVTTMLRQNKFYNITKLGIGLDLKNKCDCAQCKTENYWRKFGENIPWVMQILRIKRTLL